jgi:hypothetical protein
LEMETVLALDCAASADRILTTSCLTYAELLWDEAREPDYRRIFSQGLWSRKLLSLSMVITRLCTQT